MNIAGKKLRLDRLRLRERLHLVAAMSRGMLNE